MNLEKTSYYIQILSGLVLIVGVFLVVIELQQTRKLAEAQLESDSWEGIINRAIAQMGDEAPEAMAKACAGEKLSKRDEAVLSSRFQALLNHVYRQRSVEQLAGFDSEQWKSRAGASFMLIFSTDAGRRWWDFARQFSIDGEIVRTGDEILKSAGPPYCGPSLNASNA